MKPLAYEFFMEALFETYHQPYRMESDPEPISPSFQQRARMVVTGALTIFCLASIVFNLRFFVALCHERHVGSIERALLERRKHKKTADQAA